MMRFGVGVSFSNTVLLGIGDVGFGMEKSKSGREKVLIKKRMLEYYMIVPEMGEVSCV
jgi:hypothetical protein